MKRHDIIFLNKNEDGSVIVEATILFPIMIMIFAGLVLLAMYLPGRAQLQRATQYVATGIATARSDSSVSFDENGYSWVGGNSEFANVYTAMFSTDISSAEAKEIIVEYFDTGMIALGDGLSVECGVQNYIIYKEVYVTATKSIKSPVNLSFVGFPEVINMTVTSTAVVQNGDEFVRNMDIAVDFAKYLSEKTGIDLSGAMSKIQSVLDLMSGS